ncbi:hypothetical protein [Streptomyces purpurogeneiscleroticus]|uniref:hypothetical protein n=1 Tax=Streptomyces purpurogeneiscleroticus TaxID=68259 RepID=UPI001CBBF43A|nr:hypothetical protein [Streptomyces purpurogeneiscleroticus]MBZ4014705.1 hypothetical protein [Streptomyces purpurogeneiscleroticus]
MNHNTPLSPRPLHHLADVRHRVLTARQLREHGIAPSDLAERCRPGGPWQQILPGVHLLHPGPPTSEERLHAVLLYAARRTPAAATGPDGEPAVPVQGDGADRYEPEAMITGLAALALHRFSSAPPLLSLDRIEVLLPRSRRLRSAGFAQVVRAQNPPPAVEVTGLPVAPVPRALADAVARLTGPQTARAGLGEAEMTALEAVGGPTAIRRLLSEAVRGGHCDPTAVVRELSRARLLGRPQVMDAVDGLLAEGRALAEGLLYKLVREYRLPDPVWNVDLRLPGGPYLGGVDAFWPVQAVALTIDARSPKYADQTLWPEHTRTRERLERLGITVVQVTAKKLREAPEQQAVVVRTALMAAADREPSAYVAVLPK